MSFTGKGANPPVFNAPPATAALAAVLVVIFAVGQILPDELAFWIVSHFALVPARIHAEFLAGTAPPTGQTALTLVSHMFLHFDWLHVLVNAGMLLAFGSVVERVIGAPVFVLFFLACGLGGAVGQVLIGGPEEIRLLGASGGGYGVIGGAVPLMFSSTVAYRTRRMLTFVAVIMGVNVVFGVFGSALFGSGASIAWQDHVGGFITGLVLMAAILAVKRRF